MDKDPIAVVFLHGVGGAARIWTPQETSFAAAGYRPLPLDLLGYGARSPIAETSIEELAADVEQTIDAMRLEQPVIVGHSLGGMIAQTMMRRRPGAYRAVVLSGTSPAFGDPNGAFQKKFVADRLAPLEAGRSMADMAAEAVDGMMGPNPAPEGRALALDCLAHTPASTYRAGVLSLVRFDERANLPTIRVPVLCLAAEHDRNAPARMMERMAEKIPGARYVCLAGLGHLANLENPAAFDAPILAFLAEVTASERSAADARA